MGSIILHVLIQEGKLTVFPPFSTCGFPEFPLHSKEEKSILNSSRQENASPELSNTGSKTNCWSQLLHSEILCPSQWLAMAEILRQAWARRRAPLWCANLAACLTETLSCWNLSQAYTSKTFPTQMYYLPPSLPWGSDLLQDLSALPTFSDSPFSLRWFSSVNDLHVYTYLISASQRTQPNAGSARKQPVKWGLGWSHSQMKRCCSEEYRSQRAAHTWYASSTDDFTEVKSLLPVKRNSL